MPQITIDKYTTLDLTEYKGTYQLVEGWINREGEFKPNFCKRTFGKDKVEKTTPLSIKCGDKEALIKLAYWILEQFEEDKRTTKNNEEDLPF